MNVEEKDVIGVIWALVTSPVYPGIKEENHEDLSKGFMDVGLDPVIADRCLCDH
jgi:hypothetical protein